MRSLWESQKNITASREEVAPREVAEDRLSGPPKTATVPDVLHGARGNLFFDHTAALTRNYRKMGIFSPGH